MNLCGGGGRCHAALNESPSEKEGKFPLISAGMVMYGPSMKVPPKRKGNGDSFMSAAGHQALPQ